MTSDPDGTHADDDPAWDGLEPAVGDFAASLRGFAAGDAPPPPLELEAVFAGLLPAFPETSRRRIRLRSPLAAAAVGALLITVGLGMADRLPAARGVVSALESGLRPLHFVDTAHGPLSGPLNRPSSRLRTAVPVRPVAPAPKSDPPLVVVPATVAHARVQQDQRPSRVRTVAADSPRSVRPAHPAGVTRPAHPVHPAHPAHHPRAAHPAHPAHPVHPAHRDRPGAGRPGQAPRPAVYAVVRLGPQPPR